MTSWFRTMTQLLMAAFGLLGIFTAFIDPEVPAAVGILISVAFIVGAALWRTLSRNSSIEDVIDGPVTLGNGSVEDGQTVPAPQSKMIAMTIGAAAFAGVSAWIAVSAWSDKEWFFVLIGIAGIALFGAGTIARLRNWNTDEWLAFSPTGITVHNLAGHLTYPWRSIDRIGIYEIHHRGGSTRMFAANPDPEQAFGERGTVAEMLSSFDADGWTLTVSATVYDLDVDEMVDLARTWQQATTTDN